MNHITDPWGRTFKTLRISLTTVCNLACAYCTAKNGTGQRLQKVDEERLVDIVAQLHTLLNLETIRFTGGEPLLYPQIEELLLSFTQLKIPKLKIVTNGTQLNEKALSLKNAGITSMNISLDAIETDTFYNITRKNTLHKVLLGIHKALELEIPIKINTVMMKNMNEHQLLPLFRFAKNLNIPIRFLEIMPMGHLHKNFKQFFFSQQDILERIQQHYEFTPLPREKSSTANYWKTQDGYTFGIIANHSQPFCMDCNRLRLDSKGNLYGCLSANQAFNLTHIYKNEKLLKQTLEEALTTKKLAFSGSTLSMMEIGG